MSVSILHTNDMHGALAAGNADRLAELRAKCDLYFDTGDAIKSGNLGVPLQEEPVWKRLSALRCSAGTLGNRESHVFEAAFRAKLAGAGHPLLCANLRRRDGVRPLPASIEFVVEGLRIGVFGVMVPMVTPRMKTQAASAFLWDDPVTTAVELVRELRPRVGLLIALTHIGYRLDVALAEAAPDIDVILGGHSHTVIQSPVHVGRTAICQGGSHCRYAGVYAWSPEAGLTGHLVPLANPPSSPVPL